MNQEEIEQLQMLIDEHNKRLNVLEIQAAKFGIHCPPHISIEIKDIRQLIDNFEQKLKQNTIGSYYEGKDTVRRFGQGLDTIQQGLRAVTIKEERVYRLLGIPIWSVSVTIVRSFVMFLILVGVGSLLVVLAADKLLQVAISDKTPTPGNVVTAVPATSTPFKSTTLPSPAPIRNIEPVLVGTQLESSGWAYTYPDKSFSIVSGKQVGSFTAKGVYLSVVIFVANNTGKSQALPTNFFALKDSNGIIYMAEPQVASVAVQRGVNADASMEDPIPANGVLTSVYLVFDVPSGAKGLSLFATSNNSKGWTLDIVP